MSNENAVQLHTSQTVSLSPRSMEEALKFAEMMAKSSMVPKDFQGNTGNILVAVQWGMELGLQPMQAMQNIAVINGRPSLWGDAVIALVRSSAACEYVREEVTDTAAICRVKRRGEDEQVRTFSMVDAKTAGLLGKQGPWTQYPKRMLQMRARSWALRDVFPDVLRGMPIAEEVMDMPVERNMGAAQVVAVEQIDMTAALADVAACTDTDTLTALWKSLAAKARQAKDMAAYDEIKAAVAAKGEAIKAATVATQEGSENAA